MSRRRVIAPLGSVLTMMSAKSSSVASLPCALIESCRSSLSRVGDPPTTPAAAWTFCSRIARTTSFAERPRSATLRGSRQTRLGLRDAVLYLLLCEVRIGAELEGDGQCHAAVGGGLARHVQHALDAVDLLLERRRHRLGDDLRVRAGIVGGDDDRRRHYLRVFGDWQEAQRDDPAEEGEHRQHARKDRAVDEEARQVHDALATWGATSVPGRTRCRPLTMMRSPCRRA